MTMVDSTTALQAMLIYLADKKVGFAFDVFSTNFSLL